MADTRGWQPIETAPRDGTPILAFGAGLMLVLEWYSGLDMWQAANISGWEWDMDLENPTHWMPLPAPPEDDAKP